MKRYNSNTTKFLISVSTILTIIFLLGQTMAIVNYQFAIDIGLQEPASEITKMGIALNKGFGFGDTVVYIPMLIIGIVGIWRHKILGIYVMIGAMAITIYWPLVSLSTLFYARNIEGWGFSDYTSYSIILGTIALFGLWALIYLISNMNKLGYKSL